MAAAAILKTEAFNLADVFLSRISRMRSFVNGTYLKIA